MEAKDGGDVGGIKGVEEARAFVMPQGHAPC
jgi:hypothetical protein